MTFLEQKTVKQERLSSFGANPGGYVVVWDPKNNVWYTYSPDSRARKANQIKEDLIGEARRAYRYKDQMKV